MIVYIDVMTGCGLDHLAVVAHAVLAAVVFLAVHEKVDITGLDVVDTVAGIEGKRSVELIFIVFGPCGCFMMTYERYAFFTGIVCNFLDVEIRIRFGEIEMVVLWPISFPTDVPALDKHAWNAVFGREVDILFDMSRVCTVIGSIVPCAVAEMHLPPHADIFHRLAP